MGRFNKSQAQQKIESAAEEIRRLSRNLAAAQKRSAKIEGIGELANQIEKIGSLVGPDVVKVLAEASDIGKDEVLKGTPLGPTGNLRKAIFRDSRDPYHDPKGPSVLVGINHKIAPHWHFLELGTSKQDARPFFRPGITRSTSRMTQRIAAGCRQIISKVGV